MRRCNVCLQAQALILVGLGLMGLGIPTRVGAVTALPDVATYQARRYERQGRACLAQMGPVAACVDLLVTSTRFDPTRASTRYLLGLIYYQKGDDTEALAELANAYRLDPSLSDTLLMMGTIYLNQGRLTQAERKFRQFMTVREDPAAAYGMATVQALRGNMASAAKWLRKASAADPSWATVVASDPKWERARRDPAIEAVLGNLKHLGAR